MMNTVRQPAVAGLFYPSSARVLRRSIHRLLDNARRQPEQFSCRPKALIVPHASYLYAGPQAATAYACLDKLKANIKRVVLVGPSHRVRLRGLAMADVQYFRTPLGDVELDQFALRSLLSMPQVGIVEKAHWQEHSLEVQLPFLQVSLDSFSLVPLLLGEVTSMEIDAVFEQLWGNDDTLIIISSDLNHCHRYSASLYIDRATRGALEHFNFQETDIYQSCGGSAVQSLLRIAKRRGLEMHTLATQDHHAQLPVDYRQGCWAFAEPD